MERKANIALVKQSNETDSRNTAKSAVAMGAARVSCLEACSEVAALRRLGVPERVAWARTTH